MYSLSTCGFLDKHQNEQPYNFTVHSALAYLSHVRSNVENRKISQIWLKSSIQKIKQS